MKKHFIFVTSQSHADLGLFEDLRTVSDVDMVILKQKAVNSVLSKVKRIHTSWSINKHLPLPFRKKWYEPLNIRLKRGFENVIIIVDIALKGIDVGYLNSLFSRDDVKGVLVMINSYDAASVGMLEIKKDLSAVKWDRIMTFDPVDARKHGWEYMGGCYYSLHNKDDIIRQYGEPVKCSAYFTGGIKGDREDLTMSVFEKLYKNGVDTRFNLMVSGTRRLEKKRYDDVINYFSGGWIPYDKVLNDVFGADVIIEILQKGQHGPSLRYYEAVCYNKKLITNNPLAVKLPFYDPAFIRIIRSADDIDTDWVKSEDKADFHYDGSFSPVRLIERLR